MNVEFAHACHIVKGQLDYHIVVDGGGSDVEVGGAGAERGDLAHKIAGHISCDGDAVDEIYFNGVMSKIDSKICKANSKKIFLNNIKGERKYWKNTAKDMTPGIKAFNATKSFAKDMVGVPIINLIGAVAVVGGSVVYVANLVVAPVVSVFQKGGSISLQGGTEFEIKITENNQIRG